LWNVMTEVAETTSKSPDINRWGGPARGNYEKFESARSVRKGKGSLAPPSLKQIKRKFSQRASKRSRGLSSRLKPTTAPSDECEFD